MEQVQDYINIRDFPVFWQGLDVTVEVEAKAKTKELAVRKLAKALAARLKIRHSRNAEPRLSMKRGSCEFLGFVEGCQNETYEEQPCRSSTQVARWRFHEQPSVTGCLNKLLSTSIAL